MPASYRDRDDDPGREVAETVELEVDGERFAVRVVVDPGTGRVDTGYDWLSGPHTGYGFGSNGPAIPSWDEHRDHIRAFLAMIDPATGFIEEH